MDKTLVVAVVSLLALSAGLSMVSAQEADLSRRDEAFMKEIAMESMVEVRLGEMAGQRAEREDVKWFGERMVNEHSQVLEKMKEMAYEHNIQLPEELDEKQKSTLNTFSELIGETFDGKYMTRMVQEQDKFMQRFEQEIRKGQNIELRQFAFNALQKLQIHHQIATDIQQHIEHRARAYYPEEENRLEDQN